MPDRDTSRPGSPSPKRQTESCRTPAGESAGLWALLLVKLAVALLRISAVAILAAILAAPLLIAWLVWGSQG
jgi:hypothetical protein